MLILVPLGITCAANSMNMLEGFNGLGTGLGIIITSTLIILVNRNEDKTSLLLLIPLLGSLIAFLYFNYYPAKIFPGDTLMLFMGATIASVAIMSNLKLEGAILLLPMILEFFLKLRSRFGAQCFATNLDGDILIYEGKIESFTHLVMTSFQVSEKRLVHMFWSMQITLGFIVILIF